jgi:hypothetical protein
MAANLPSRHERLAPCFDDSRPNEIEQYFSDLGNLFNTYAVGTDLARKQATIKYLKAVATENLWKLLPAYLDAARSFNNFKVEILALYPSSSRDHAYSIQDLNILIGKCVRVGIFSTNDATDYYCQFLLITCFLISKNRLSTIDLLHNFMHRLHPDLAYHGMQ